MEEEEYESIEEEMEEEIQEDQLDDNQSQTHREVEESGEGEQSESAFHPAQDPYKHD